MSRPGVVVVMISAACAAAVGSLAFSTCGRGVHSVTLQPSDDIGASKAAPDDDFWTLPATLTAVGDSAGRSVAVSIVRSGECEEDAGMNDLLERLRRGEYRLTSQAETEAGMNALLEGLRTGEYKLTMPPEGEAGMKELLEQIRLNGIPSGWKMVPPQPTGDETDR